MLVNDIKTNFFFFYSHQFIMHDSRCVVVFKKRIKLLYIIVLYYRNVIDALTEPENVNQSYSSHIFFLFHQSYLIPAASYSYLYIIIFTAETATTAIIDLLIFKEYLHENVY